MNIYVILLGAFVIILMVMFGHSPMDDIKKKRAQERNGGLVYKIEQYNKKQHPHDFGSAFVGGNRSSGRNPRPARDSDDMQPTSQDSSQNNSYYPPAAPGAPPSPLQQPAQPQAQQ